MTASPTQRRTDYHSARPPEPVAGQIVRVLGPRLDRTEAESARLPDRHTTRPANRVAQLRPLVLRHLSRRLPRRASHTAGLLRHHGSTPSPRRHPTPAVVAPAPDAPSGCAGAPPAPSLTRGGCAVPGRAMRGTVVTESDLRPGSAHVRTLDRPTHRRWSDTGARLSRERGMNDPLVYRQSVK